MIAYLAQVLSLFASTLQNILLTASVSGRIIIAVVTWIINQFLKVTNRFVTFFQIVYEDNVSIFTEELPNSAIGIVETIRNQFLYLQDSLASVYFCISDEVTTLLISLSWFINAFAVVVYEVLLLVKNAVILIGGTTWFTITFIPIQLPLLLRSLTMWLSGIIVNKIINAYMALLKITNFLTEVPLESFIGITSAIIIVRLCVHFRETLLSQVTVLYFSMVRQMTYLYYAAYNYFFNSEVRVITRMASGEEIGAREVNLSASEVDDPNNTDALCVICQERQKCVLTLPCRHVCLCTECCRRLYGYQRTCPICRTFIYHSVTVYL